MPDANPYGLPHSDAELVARIRAGDVAAYTAAFRAYYLSIVEFLERYLPSDSAEDLAQEVFIRFWEGRKGDAPIRSLRAYLFTSARNRALNLLKHDGVTSRYSQATGQFHEDADMPREPQPDELLAASELGQAAEARAAMLSPRLREVYHLSRHEGLTAAEIAEVLGTSVQTVYTQLTKITQALYPVLKGWMEG